MAEFPDSPMFTGINAPSRVEADAGDLQVIGSIPREIDGAFYRVAADHQFAPRFGRGDQIRWFTAPNLFTSHVMNAFEDGDRIHFDTCVSKGNLFPWFPEFGKPFDPSGMAVRLTRWTVNLASRDNGFEKVTTLSDFIGEFSRNDDRYQASRYRHGWLLGFEATDIARGPIATVKIPFRLKPAYHGSWSEAARVKPSGLPVRG